MTGRDEVLAELAELTDQRIHEQRLQLIAAARNANPPATWAQIGAVFGQTASNAHRKYGPRLDETVRRLVRVKPANTNGEGVSDGA